MYVCLCVFVCCINGSPGNKGNTLYLLGYSVQCILSLSFHVSVTCLSVCSSSISPLLSPLPVTFYSFALSFSLYRVKKVQSLCTYSREVNYNFKGTFRMTNLLTHKGWEGRFSFITVHANGQSFLTSFQGAVLGCTHYK